MASDQSSSAVVPCSKEEALTAVCHCGRVRVRLPSRPEFVNECHCTVCYKYGALWSYFPRATVTITTASDTTLHSYTRADADGDIEFARCGHCGCMMCWRGVGEYAGPEHDIGVNCRMIPEKEIEGITKRVSKGPGNN
jgi:hypothetical protein